MKMLISSYSCSCLCLVLLVITFVVGTKGKCSQDKPHRILWDTDMDTDDVFAFLYLLKLNRSEFDLHAITLNANGWSNVGHSVNHVYDILYMMDRDDVAVGVGGEGGITEDGTIMSDVGGYLPIIEQGIGTSGYCRYRQAIPVGIGGRLDIDTNFGFRKSFLPQGDRKYSPLQQKTAQQVMIDTISAGLTTVFLTGAHTNFAIFLMKNPHLKRNVRHIYIMGGAVRSIPTGCGLEDSNASCFSNMFSTYYTNPYAEFNFFTDPFAAYQVIHSGIPITLVPLDATNTIPISRNFYEVLEKNQHTYEAQYCFKALKMVHDSWIISDLMFENYFMWDSFMAGVATSIMRKPHNHQGENEFAEMEFMNITVVTSNKPYGVSDGSNPFFDGLKVPKFNLTRNCVHSGHVQTGLRDKFCLVENKNGKCKDGYSAETTDEEAVQVLVAVKAKSSSDNNTLLNREFFRSFLDVLNQPEHSGRFNFTTQFPYFQEILYRPSFKGVKLGKNVVFDMDMSAGDFLVLIYLLKLPVEVLNLKGILVTPTGWANAATIDVVYDLLHMMGRDDIPVGLGEVFAMNQSDPSSSAVGDCKYQKAIPHGSGGLLDSDTLYGFARSLPRSPRRYTAEKSVKFGAPRDTEHPEHRQPLALEVWKEIVESLDLEAKISVLTNGPLTNLANIIISGKKFTSSIEEIHIVGGHISNDHLDKGNVINVPENEYAELNMFLDPLAAKTVIDSGLNITIIPLNIQRKVCDFQEIVEKLHSANKTPESLFALHLLSRLHRLQRTHPRYQHMDIFLGEIVGALILGSDQSILKPDFALKSVKVHATGFEYVDGQITIDEKQGKAVRVVEDLNAVGYYDVFADRLGDEKQTAVVGSFNEQRRRWSKASGRQQYKSQNN